MAGVVYEGFVDYVDGTDLRTVNGGTGFTEPWTGRNTLLNSGNGIPAGGGIYILETSLSYADADGKELVTNGGSLYVEGSQGNVHLARPYDRTHLPNTDPDPQTGKVTYVSFLMQRLGDAADPSADVYGGSYPWGDNLYPRAAGINLFSNDAGDAVPLFIGGVSNATDDVWRLRGQDLDGVSKDPKSELPFGAGNAVYFVVLKVEHGTGDGMADVVKVFLNPSLTGEAANEVSIVAGWETRDDPLYLPGDWLGIEVGDASGYRPYAELVFDEYRIGESWAAVTPHVNGVASAGSYLYAGASLGWMYQDDAPWFYSFTLRGWVYSPDLQTTTPESGVWLYLPR